MSEWMYNTSFRCMSTEPFVQSCTSWVWIMRLSITVSRECKLIGWIWLFDTLADHKDAPTKGIFLSLPVVFNRRQGWGIRLRWGVSVLRTISDFNNPTASPKRIPVSLRREINHLKSSSIVMQVCCISLITSTGIGLRVVSLNPSGMKVPKKPLVPSNPCSLIARLMIDRNWRILSLRYSYPFPYSLTNLWIQLLQMRNKQ